MNSVMGKLDERYIYSLMRHMKWNHNDLAAAAKITPSMVSKFFGGRRITLPTLRRIAAAFGVPVGRLILGDE